jgi:hypothetical protein
MLELTIFEIAEDHWDIVVTDGLGRSSTYEGYETAGVGLDEIIFLNPDQKMLVTIAPLSDEHHTTTA